MDTTYRVSSYYGAVWVNARDGKRWVTLDGMVMELITEEAFAASDLDIESMEHTTYDSCGICQADCNDKEAQFARLFN